MLISHGHYDHLDLASLRAVKESAERGKAYSQKINEKAISRGKLTQEKLDQRMALLSTTLNYNDLKDADIKDVFRTIVQRRGAGAVLHTHSVWGPLLSDSHGLDGGLTIEGYEMLKGLDGVRTHEHREWVPIVPNDQDMTRLSREVGSALDRNPAVHAILLQRHGLYTWGKSLGDPVRHIEIFEFLFETMGRTRAYGSRGGHHGIAQDS